MLKEMYFFLSHCDIIMHKSVQNAYLTMYSHTAMCVSLKKYYLSCQMNTEKGFLLNAAFFLHLM